MPSGVGRIKMFLKASVNGPLLSEPLNTAKENFYYYYYLNSIPVFILTVSVIVLENTSQEWGKSPTKNYNLQGQSVPTPH